MQSAVFELLGIGAEEAEAKFGFLLDALRYGAPPHGGIAFGIDRIAPLMAGTESIRDVIAFPQNTAAQCPITGAPSPVTPKQHAEAHRAVQPHATGGRLDEEPVRTERNICRRTAWEAKPINKNKWIRQYI